MPADVWDAPAEAPILVLGSGQRCGSTLVQRLLTSHPGVLVWGEHGGHLRQFFGLNSVLEQWDAHEAEAGRREFAQSGYNSWIANMLPGREPLREAARAYLRTWLAEPAAELGRPRWGFKEVRFSFFDAQAMQRLFPGLVAIHLTRDPRDVLVSLEYWERRGGWPREYTEIAMQLWEGVSRTFLDAETQPWVLSRRYEDVIADPATFIAEVAELLGTDPDRFDRSVFDKKLHGENKDRQLKQFESLPRDLRKLLQMDGIEETRRRLQYF